MSDAAAAYTERLRWFHEARFGLFIHWGPYAVLGQGEWAMFTQRIPVREYARLARRFTAKKFDADAWARMAVDAGMRYAVLTARHHDGFCLYDSKASDFTSVKIGARRDLVAEYVAACRKAGLKVGLYYSLLDWRFPGNFEPAKFPESSQAMVEQAHAQMRELMTNYGTVDVVWYDGGYVYNGMTSRADMAPFWRAAEINAMARQLQPGIIINNRIGLDEDIDTPEQHVKASAPGRAWESCMTMHDAGWGYVRSSPAMQTAPQLLGHLVTAAAGEGNFLLNVGPKPDGTISEGGARTARRHRPVDGGERRGGLRFGALCARRTGRSLDPQGKGGVPDRAPVAGARGDGADGEDPGRERGAAWLRFLAEAVDREERPPDDLGAAEKTARAAVRRDQGSLRGGARETGGARPGSVPQREAVREGRTRGRARFSRA